MAENQEATPKKILIVEDEEYLRDLYVELLTEAGYDVDSASAGKEGYVKMKRGGYDLVLLDIMLPEIDGLEILKRLTEAPSEKPNKNIVLLTNLSKDLTISRGVALGIQGYIIKSDLTPGQFIKEIKTYFLN